MTTIVADGYSLIWATLCMERKKLERFDGSDREQIEERISKILNDALASVGNKGALVTVQLRVIYGNPETFKAYSDQLTESYTPRR